MANQYTVFEGLRSQLVTATTGLVDSGSTPIETQIGIGWPGQANFNDLVANPQRCLVSVYDRKISHNVQKMMPHLIQTNAYSCGITATLNKTTLPPAGVATITLAGSVGLNDAVGLGIHLGREDFGATASAVGGETLTTLAVKLRDSINAVPNNSVLSATAAGAVVTITNVSSGPLRLGTAVGNVQDWYVEVARQQRQGQVIIWTTRGNVRKVVGGRIEEFLGALQADFGYQLSNPTQNVRVTLCGTMLVDTDVQSDIYRQDFGVWLEYGITRIDRAYSVLAGVGSYRNLDTGQKI